MKRFIAAMLLLSLMLSLASCKKGPESLLTTISQDTAEPGTTEPTASATEPAEETTAPLAEPQTTNRATTTAPATTEETQPNVPVDTPTNGDGKTFTGRDPLPLADFKSFDPNNKKGLPTTKIAHAYGVAANEKPHSISVNNQKFFDEKGYDALALDTKSQGKVLYLTFDAGYENGYTAKILDTLKEKGVKAAFFCTLPQIKQYPQLIARMINEGHIVGNHSNTHPSFAEISRTQMAKEMQDYDDYLRTKFGYSAPVFRFPKGEYSESALDLVESLGYKSVFWSVAYGDWDLDNQKGKDYAVSTVTARLHPGAVILLHSVSPDNAAALGDIIDWARAKGYTFKSLL
ncbi:MAG: polysaccharide deacetylase family protein [Oscillospiraceae bacterium]|jgi:peptidoglycan-N-acetylmuramic acid deacetylase|nr:polysaccharide deacetylase family protein [Oscillospiraceae bacterium]